MAVALLAIPQRTRLVGRGSPLAKRPLVGRCGDQSFRERRLRRGKRRTGLISQKTRGTIICG